MAVGGSSVVTPVTSLKASILRQVRALGEIDHRDVEAGLKTVLKLPTSVSVDHFDGNH